MAKKPPISSSVFGLSRDTSLMDHLQLVTVRKGASGPKGVDAELHVIGSEVTDAKKLEHEIFGEDLVLWQQNLLADRAQEILFMQAKRCPVWLARPKLAQAKDKTTSHHGLLEASSYSIMRDKVGGLWPALRDFKGMKHLSVVF